MLTAHSYFAGIGGLDRAAEHAGFVVRDQVEIDPFCRTVLDAHFPNARLHEDIRAFNPTYAPDLVFGGFPCQDLSQANPWAVGLSGERSGLFYELMRCVRLVRPQFVLLENVPGLVTSGELYRVLAAFADIGFDAEWTVISAESLGAPIERKRVCVMASPDGERLRDVWLLARDYSEVHRRTLADDPLRLGRKGSLEWRLPPPGLPIVADGFPPRMDDYRAVGNAVCSVQFYPFFAAIAKNLGINPPQSFEDPWREFSVVGGIR